MQSGEVEVQIIEIDILRKLKVIQMTSYTYLERRNSDGADPKS